MGQAGSLEENDTTSLENVEFYTNKIPSRPAPCGLIDDIHQRWLCDWDLLEEHHGYVKLFVANKRVMFNGYSLSEKEE